MKVKLVLFIMDHLIWVHLGVLALVGAMIASLTSITLAVVFVIACGVLLQVFLHNSNPLTPWLRERNDQVILRACRSAGFSPVRRMYRWLPSDPHCRLFREIDRQQAQEVLPVGVGLHIGVASVGNVGERKTKDFTAVGDVVNTAARLQSSALAGQIVVSDEIYARAADHRPQAEPVSLSLKGKAEPVRAHVIHAHRGAA